MYITNYEDLTPECQEFAEWCGNLAKAVLSLKDHPEVKNPHKESLVRSLRGGLMHLSRKTHRTIELLTVRGEVWLNIRSGSQKSISLDGIKKMIAPHKQYQISANESGEIQVPISDLRQNLQNRWNWLR